MSSLPWAPGRQASLAIVHLMRRPRVVEPERSGDSRRQNNIHRLRDGVWKEDPSRTRSPNAACAPTLLRTALLAPIRASGRTSLTTPLESFAENKASAFNLI